MKRLAATPATAAGKTTRRRLIETLPAFGAGLLAAGPAAAQQGSAAKPKAERFPGDPPEHKLVYQLNKAGDEHGEAILNSIGAMIGKYADNVAIAVVAFGPGIHLLAKAPKRPVSAQLRERARSQAKSYRVRFIACGNTMKTYRWTGQDMVDFAEVEEVGASTLMELQEQGYAYIAW
ncbi:DsrE family protein [Piscinibacter sakaiensis]|uniref:DsrE family protein n=1 Tax=Piscinibacter sakaiensis TaxID=1547922 RepID=UPI003AAE9AAA